MILTVARMSLIEARHARLLWLAFAVLAASLLLAEFSGALVLTDHRAAQGGLLGSLLRLGMVFLTGLYVTASLLREQQDHTIDLFLAIDAPRSHYALGKLLAFILLGVLFAAAAGLLALAYASPAAALRWSVSLACELALAAALATLLAFTLGHVTSALAVFAGTYLLARGLGGLQLLLADPIQPLSGLAGVITQAMVTGLAWLLPDLWRFTDPQWLGRGSGDWGDVALVLGQTAVYLPLLVAAALFDLYRRAF